MHLLPDERHVAALEPLIADADPDVAGLAWRALRNQRRTPEWRAAVERIADAGPGGAARRRAASGWTEQRSGVGPDGCPLAPGADAARRP